MGYVEIMYPDKSGLLVEGGKIKEVRWEYCDKCRSIATDGVDEPNLGIFICQTCLNTANVTA